MHISLQPFFPRLFPILPKFLSNLPKTLVSLFSPSLAPPPSTPFSLHTIIKYRFFQNGRQA